MKHIFYSILYYCFAFFLSGCEESKENTPLDMSSRNFDMGFTTWSFGPNQQDIDDTYAFISANSSIYVEHIDINIPWKAWINNLTLPNEFINEINGRVHKRLEGKKLLLSVSLLNLSRDDLAQDFDGSIPAYSGLNDEHIEKAYFKHVDYLINQFSPDYLVIAIEVNELRLRSSDKWDGYKLLIRNVASSVKQSHSNLPISESISLHNLYDSDTDNPTEYIDEVIHYMNQMDFVAISYYPFLKNQSTQNEIQRTFDFLHANINKPIAFVESGQIAENLVIPNLNVSINGSPEGQQTFLKILLENAQEQDYEFVTWWAHRDFDALWEIFPEELKDVGQLWRDTGLLDENGKERLSFSTWKFYFDK